MWKRRDKMEERLHQLNLAIEKNPNDPAPYLERAHLFFDLHEYQKCIKDCEQSIVLDKTNEMVYISLGRAHCRLKAYDKALANYNKAIVLNEDYARAYNSRGSLYYDLKDYDKALADYSKAITLDEDYARAYNNRGNLYENLNNYDKALADYNKAITLDKDYARAYNNRGNLYKNLKDYDKALADYNKAIALDEAYALSYNNRGNLYSESKEYDKAFADYNKAIALDELYALAYNSRGNLYKNLKDYDKALADYNKSKDLFLKKENFLRVRIIEEQIKEINGLRSKSNTINQKIKRLMDKIDDSSIEDSIDEIKKSFIQFITEKKEYPSINTPKFVILRRWNSYTPIIAENYRISKGGGYFFKTPDCGIVIDPGFNFIDNFKETGHQFHEIDHILITHAHNDHTADLESILTLLHQYNEMILGDFGAPDDNTIMHEVLAEQKEKVTEEDRDRIEDLAKK